MPATLFASILDRPIELARVRLRRLEESDAAEVFAIHRVAEVARYQSRPAMTEPAEAVELIARVRTGYAQGSSLQLAIERKTDGVLLGECGLFHIHETSRRAEIGYTLGRPYWGQGYMHEALTALVDLAFGTIGLNRLEADIDPRNASSERSLQRLGFTREGQLRERWIVAGEVSDTVFFGLLAREWRGGA